MVVLLLFQSATKCVLSSSNNYTTSTASPRVEEARIYVMKFFFLLLVSRFRKVYSRDQYNGIKPPSRFARKNPYPILSGSSLRLNLHTSQQSAKGSENIDFMFTHRSCDTIILAFFAFTISRSVSTKLLCKKLLCGRI